MLTKDDLIRRSTIVDRGYKTPCWIFKAVPTGSRYCYVQIGKKKYLVHALSYQLFREDYDKKLLQIDHLCKVKTCINPDHLELVTPDTNKRRYWRGVRNDYIKRARPN